MQPERTAQPRYRNRCLGKDQGAALVILSRDLSIRKYEKGGVEIGALLACVRARGTDQVIPH